MGLPIRNVQSCTRTHVDKSTMRMECIYKNTEDNLNQNGHFLCACESRCLLHAAMFASDFHFIVFVRVWIFSIAICAVWHLLMCVKDFWKFLLRKNNFFKLNIRSILCPSSDFSPNFIAKLSWIHNRNK